MITKTTNLKGITSMGRTSISRGTITTTNTIRGIRVIRLIRGNILNQLTTSTDSQWI